MKLAASVHTFIIDYIVFGNDAPRVKKTGGNNEMYYIFCYHVKSRHFCLQDDY